MQIYGKYFNAYGLITLVATLLFIPFLGSVHLFDWDEINFAECAREMILTGDYSRVQINFQPFWEKPPLFIWLQVLCMKIFGINEFAARLPNALCGIITLNTLYYFGKKYISQSFALLWVMCYASSFLPFLYFKSGIIDPWFNFFIFLSICFLIQWFYNFSTGKMNLNALYAGLFAGLAVLTKGPVAILIIGLTFLISWIRLKFNPFKNWKNILLFTIVFLLSGLSWFIFEIINGNLFIIREFIDYQVRLFNTHDSGHEGFRLYHFVILLLGCFPASIFFIASHKKNISDSPFQVYVKVWMLILFWVVLLIFTIVNTKIVHYSSMCYFPVTYLAAYTLHDIIYSKKKLSKILYILGIVLISVWSLAFILVGLFNHFIPTIIKSNIIQDAAVNEALKMPVPWYGFEWVIGVFFLIASLYFFTRIYQNKKYIVAFFATSLLSVWLLVAVIAPKVEPYSQGAAVAFYQSLQEKDCYVESLRFKSYATYFYSAKKPDCNTPAMLNYIKEREKQSNPNDFSFNTTCMHWLLNEAIDKPAYFAAKINEAEGIKQAHPNLKELYQKGGFIFYVRLPNKP